MRGGGELLQGFLGWIMCVILFAVCLYYTWYPVSEIGKHFATGFGILFFIMIIGMPIEVFAKHRNMSLYLD
jgi:hypothetical protein